MTLTCQLSGIVPTEPVVTPDGYLYERRVIEQHLEKSQTCPISGKLLHKKDLIPLQQSHIKRPTAAIGGDVGSLLKGVQDQFDLLSVENMRLLRERDELRQQMTRLMYVRDGAVRAIAQKIEEIDHLKGQMENMSKSSSVVEPSQIGDQMEDSEIFNNTVMRWDQLSRSLLLARKQRAVTYRSPEDMKDKYQVTLSHEDPLAGCFDILLSNGSGMNKLPQVVAYGRTDGQLCVRDLANNRDLCNVSGHDGRINCVTGLVYPSQTNLPPSTLAMLGATTESSSPYKSVLNILTGGEDGTVRLWKEDRFKRMDDCLFLGESPIHSVANSRCGRYIIDTYPESLDFSCEHVFRIGGKGQIKTIKQHPGGTHFAVTRSVPGWVLINAPECRVSRRFDEDNIQLNDIAFQPDGAVVVGVQNDSVAVWDLRVKDLKTVCKVPSHLDQDKLVSIDFSEVGYLVVTPTSGGKCLLWDLRKADVVQEFDLGAPVTRARFDYSGKHVAMATADGRAAIWTNVVRKRYEPVESWNFSEALVDVRFEHLTDDYIMTLSSSGKFHCISATT